jgi:imidazolonepropionase-like amidohydrolase
MQNRLGKKYSHLASNMACRCCSPEVQQLVACVTADMSRRAFLGGAAAVTAAFVAGLPGEARAKVPAIPKEPITFTNLRLFDGVSNSLRTGLRVIVDGKIIKTVEGNSGPLPAGARTIDCGGRVLMPGMIDCHWHAMLAAIPLPVALTADIGYIYLKAGQEAERTLMRGYTTIRDVGGPSFSLKRAIDEGSIAGPRIYPAGSPISQTSGHGDFRNIYEIPRTATSQLSRGEVVGGGIIADGVDDVRRRTREQLMSGACFIKVLAGGGVASLYDPLDATQYSPDELRAAVEAADDWGTYVTVHAYNPRSIQRSIAAGVKCIEHGQLADETSVKMMADKGVRWCLQPFLADEDANKYSIQEQIDKLAIMSEGTNVAYGLAKKHGIKVGWGTDILFNQDAASKQTNHVAKMVRWYSPIEVLKMVTADNAELLSMSGMRNPYKAKLGVIEAGAFADMLLVDGDPTIDPKVLIDAEKNMKIIMKDGRLFKNSLA